MNARDMAADLNAFQEMARTESVDRSLLDDLDERRRTDVTGRWKGFDSEGYGMVEYNGKIYSAVILSNTCKQKNALVNLRRTSVGNFADWQ